VYTRYTNLKGEVMVTIYTKNNCVQCDATKRMMDKLGVAYDTVNMTTNPEELDKVMALGFRAAPVVITDSDGSWSGFNPSKIEALAS
jgi:glutaredoxin-like protein NrdH